MPGKSGSVPPLRLSSRESGEIGLSSERREIHYMYDFVDRPISSLDRGGRFLTWTLRNWVRALSEGRCPAAAVGPAFANWSMIGGLQPFHRMLMLFNAHGLQAFRVAPAECRCVAEDEAIFLSLVNGLEHMKPADSRDTLALLVEEVHIGAAFEALALLGGVMRQASLFPGKPKMMSDRRREG
jgi:hypothetical protein